MARVAVLAENFEDMIENKFDELIEAMIDHETKYLTVETYGLGAYSEKYDEYDEYQTGEFDIDMEDYIDKQDLIEYLEKNGDCDKPVDYSDAHDLMDVVMTYKEACEKENKWLKN